jgi:hypothetical protein
MFDSNWDLINGEDAHAIEVLNQASQVNLIEAILRFLTHHDETSGPSCGICPDQAVVRELHRTGTLLLLMTPGVYRQPGCDVYVPRPDGTRHQAPAPERLEDLMAEFESELRAMWPTATAAEIAAFSLWKINWVHPFKNGNGRTARAFAYTCVCLKAGQMLPGVETMIHLIDKTRPAFYDCLAKADRSFEQDGVPDLVPLRAYVLELLVQQISSIPGPSGP